MPQVTLKGISREKVVALSAEISKTVATLIDVPEEWIVVEHNDAVFLRCGTADNDTTLITILWKKRPAELQQAVAAALAKLLQAHGQKTVEVCYTSLDMNDFYEYKA